jgi:hypothetical protein
MLGHRCMSDAISLPNGKIVLIGGTEEGLSNLDHRPNSCNCPNNEPWIYDPFAPAGRRYRRTGAYTNIARMYHGSHIMTSYGDILVGGSTIAEGFTSYHMRDFSVTTYEWAEFRYVCVVQFLLSQCQRAQAALRVVFVVAVYSGHSKYMSCWPGAQPCSCAQSRRCQLRGFHANSCLPPM